MKENQKMSVKENRVIMNADGLPVAWELLRLGENRLTINGVPASFSLAEEHMDRILSNHTRKGIEIPIDANHASVELAKALGVDEDALEKLDPTRAGDVTLGFGKLKLEDDSVWVHDLKWNPIGSKLMSERLYKYFSPVLKGLDTPENLRITSIALTNEPRLNNLPELVASEDAKDEMFPVFAGAEINVETETTLNPKQKESSMDELKKMLCEMLGITPESLDTPEGIAEAKSKLDAMKKKTDDVEELAESCKKELDMSEVTPVALRGRIAILSEAAKQVPALRKELDELKMSEVTRQKDALIAQGKAEGKITNATEPHLRKMDVIALSELLKDAPVVVSVGSMGPGVATDACEGSLSESELRMCETMGISKEKFLEQKKGN